MTNRKLITATSSTITIEEIHSDILIQILRRLDGQSLISINSTNSYLYEVSSDPDLWHRICLSTWPSLLHPHILPLLNSSPKRFFMDVFPFPSSFSPMEDTDFPNKLISSIDLYHHGIPVFSHVIQTDTSTLQFRESPFLIIGPPVSNIVSPEYLTLSWIVIDPANGRAVNLSSQTIGVVENLSCSVGMTVVRFTLVSAGWVVLVVATWQNKPWNQMNMGLTVVGLDDEPVIGIEGLRVVKAAMEAERIAKKEVNESYLEYLAMKRRKNKI